MKLLTGRRIGQSRGELAAAASFSLVLHVIILSGALLISLYVRPRIYVPPFYKVNLVDLPADAPLLPPSMSGAPASALPPKRPASPKKAAIPAKQAPPKPVPLPAAAPKGAMPELDAGTKKKEHVVEDAPPRPEAAGARPEKVAVTSASQEFQFPPYVAIVRDKVERNWNPPPGAKGTKVTVEFRVLRSGRVGETKLRSSSGNFYFDQAAMRAILASNPFPPLPEGFFKDYEVFSVDLIEKE